jgi:hypothetical protein
MHAGRGVNAATPGACNSCRRLGECGETLAGPAASSSCADACACDHTQTYLSKLPPLLTHASDAAQAVWP